MCCYLLVINNKRTILIHAYIYIYIYIYIFDCKLRIKSCIYISQIVFIKYLTYKIIFTLIVGLDYPIN